MRRIGTLMATAPNTATPVSTAMTIEARRTNRARWATGMVKNLSAVGRLPALRVMVPVLGGAGR